MYITTVQKAYNEEDINNIAKAIQKKTGNLDKYRVSEMANAIKNIPQQPLYELNIQYTKMTGLNFMLSITLTSGNKNIMIVPNNLPVKVYDNDLEELLEDVRLNANGIIKSTNTYGSSSIRVETESVGLIDGTVQIFNTGL